MDDVSFHIMKGETYGRGGGERAARVPWQGPVRLFFENQQRAIFIWGETDIAGLKGADLKKMRRKVQIIFQDPLPALNPRRTVRQILEPFEIHGMKGEDGCGGPHHEAPLTWWDWICTV